MCGKIYYFPATPHLLISMLAVSEQILKMASHLRQKYDFPVLVFRGAVFKALIIGGTMELISFLGFEGTSSSFLVTNTPAGDLTICSVKAISEPKVYRNKIRDEGKVEVIKCRVCEDTSGRREKIELID